MNHSLKYQATVNECGAVGEYSVGRVMVTPPLDDALPRRHGFVRSRTGGRRGVRVARIDIRADSNGLRAQALIADKLESRSLGWRDAALAGMILQTTAWDRIEGGCEDSYATRL